jgi:hypothetical protein
MVETDNLQEALQLHDFGWQQVVLNCLNNAGNGVVPPLKHDVLRIPLLQRQTRTTLCLSQARYPVVARTRFKDAGSDLLLTGWQ